MKINELLEKTGVKISCGCTEDTCSHCAGKHTLAEVGKTCSCCGNKIREISIKETASAGGMSAGAVASVANPSIARSKPKKKKGIAPNALDTSDNLMGGKTIKR